MYIWMYYQIGIISSSSANGMKIDMISRMATGWDNLYERDNTMKQENAKNQPPPPNIAVTVMHGHAK